MGQWSSDQLQEHVDVVVAGAAVQVELVAAGTSVHDDPLAVTAHGNGERFHRRAALRGAIAGLVVDVTAPQAAGTVVSVRRAHSVGRDIETAVTAAEGARTPRAGAVALIARHERTSRRNAGR